MLPISTRSPSLRTVLEYFFENPGAERYVRELARSIGEPVASVQRHLLALEKEGVLKSRKHGPLKHYFLNADYRYLPELRSVVLREARRLKLEENLKKIIGILKKSYPPEKVILFGSLARGRVSPDSDIDILIVKRGVAPRYWDRVRELAPLLSGCSVGVDYLIWTPEEFELGRQENRFLKEEVLDCGRVVYERAA
ncbi:MAG: nucleotidyltransferase domain-containing protein [Pseudomonadota bacterium]